MDHILAATGLAVDSQALRVVSKDAQLQDMSAMSAAERAAEQAELKKRVPAPVYAAVVFRRKKLSNETLDPANIKPFDITKYYVGHVYMWDEDRLNEEVEKAGDWGLEDPVSDILGDGGNVFDITIGNDDSFAKGGYAKSEFSQTDPPVPEATVKAFAAVVQTSVDAANALVLPHFGPLIRLLKAEIEIPRLDKVDAEKEERAKRLRHGEDGGYGATDDPRESSTAGDKVKVAPADAADGEGAKGGARWVPATMSIVDSVMGDHVTDHPTGCHTRVSNFMMATGTDPESRAVVPKNRRLAVRTSAEFINRLTAMGDILVRDHFKAMIDRVIKPADMGGIAGVRLVLRLLIPYPARSTARSNPVCKGNSRHTQMFRPTRVHSPSPSLSRSSHLRAPSTSRTISCSSSRSLPRTPHISDRTNYRTKPLATI